MLRIDKYSYISGGEKKKKEYLKGILKQQKIEKRRDRWIDFTGWIMSYIMPFIEERYKGDDEFHKSLDMSHYVHYMGKWRQRRYMRKLVKRRQGIHERTLDV